ncbi:pyruvate formate lyase family protein, partial [Vibrio sp. 10N.261.49.C12]|uniref:pyruvate formate lyase family protein n=1 Tax=Vibrio sp. 10N.261.49.C12 TaxID=3229671 RepID=UPI00354E5272
HLAVDNEKILFLGINGLLEEVREFRATNDIATFEGLKKEQFYKATEIVLLSIQQHMVSYATLASEMALIETREERKAELEAIAENCHHVAYH